MIDEEQRMTRRGRRIGDRELEVQYELMKIIAEQNNEVMFEYDVASDCGAIFEVKNGVISEIMDYENFLAKMDNYREIFHKEDRALFKKSFLKCLKRPMQFVMEARCSFRGENMTWYRLFIASIDDLEGNITTVAGRFISIDAEKEINDSIKHQAERDALTGVYNHITFEKKCEQFLSVADSQTILLMIDIDDFKIINDTLGHNVGDMVLGQTGKILKSYLRDIGFAGRLGGDEFALMAWGFKDREEIVEFCNKLRMELKNIIFDMEYSASMGVAILDDRGLTFKDMYYEADQAVYASKRKGKNQINYYDEISNEMDELSTSTEEDIRVSEKTGTDYNYYCLDEHIEFIFVCDTATKKITYTNKKLREKLGENEDYFVNNFTFDLAKPEAKRIDDFDKVGEQFFVSKASERKDEILTKCLGERDFIFHVVPMKTNGDSYILISMINLDDAKMVDVVFKKREKMIDAIKRSVNVVSSSETNLERELCFQILSEFYDADCVALVKYNDGAYNELEEIHKPNVDGMVQVIRNIFEKGDMGKRAYLVDAEDNIFISDVKSLEAVDSVLYKNLIDSRVWSVLGNRIGRNGSKAGLFLLFNPRQNTMDNTLISAMGAFLAGDLLRDEALKSQKYIQTHDRLTGLRKRDTLENVDASEYYESSSLGLFVTDIVGLGEINKDRGYIVGDEKVCEVADTLKSVFAGYNIYRYDDDEMVVMCPDIAIKDFQNMIRWAREMLSELSCQVASGYSWNTDINIQEQVNEAEKMIVIEKENLKLNNNMAELTNAKVRNEVIEQLNIGQFVVYLQPKMNIEENKVVGAEALVRLNTPDRGIVAPGQFVSTLEQHDVIHLVDLFVLDDVCQYQRRLIDQGIEPVTISVNFSKRTLYFPDIIESVKNIVDKYALPTGLVQIEITETVGDMDHLVLTDVANSLRIMGFELAMDDFGTKYSNLEMLVKFQFGVAKIDRSLIIDIVGNEKNCIVLSHLIKMIFELGIECVVEGVEEAEQVEILRGMGCKVIQGFYFGRPIPEDDFYDTFIN